MPLRHRHAVEGLPIADARQIRALASPIRQDVIDAVSAIGPCSVAQLAQAIAAPADGLYYHVKRLLAVGLLEATGGTGGRGELRVDVAHQSFYLKYEPSNTRNRNAILRVAGAMLRSAERSFRRGFRAGAVVRGPRRNLWAARNRGALSPAEVEQLNALLHRLIVLMRSGRRDRGSAHGQPRTMHEFTFVLAPSISRQRARRSR